MTGCCEGWKGRERYVGWRLGGGVGRSRRVAGEELWRVCARFAERMSALRLVGSGDWSVEDRSWSIRRSVRRRTRRAWGGAMV